MLRNNLMIRKKSKNPMINKKFNYTYKAMISCCLNWRKNTESKNQKF